LTAPIDLSTRQPVRAQGSDFSGLATLIRDSGLMRRRRLYYVLRFSIVLGLFAAGWVAFFTLGDSWWQLLVAAFMGIMFTQIAFLGHDIGHRQVFGSKRVADIAGLVIGNLAIGLGFGWWVNKHTRHHANPNHVDDDPDIALGVILWTEEQAEQRRGSIARWFGARQAYWFFPVLLFEGLQLKVESFRSLTTDVVRRKAIEATLLGAHTVAYLTALFLVLPVGMALAFLVVHLGVFGVYMGCSFAPNHKGMALLDEKMDYLRKQVLTSRNVRGSLFVDYLLGGLNYQIEHHLFPSMPMPNLAKAQPIIRAYCEKVGVSYYEVRLLQSYGQILDYLHEVGAPIRAARSPA
jgi:fatty acid desaturase